MFNSFNASKITSIAAPSAPAAAPATSGSAPAPASYGGYAQQALAAAAPNVAKKVEAVSEHVPATLDAQSLKTLAAEVDPTGLVEKVTGPVSRSASVISETPCCMYMMDAVADSKSEEAPLGVAFFAGRRPAKVQVTMKRSSQDEDCCVPPTVELPTITLPTVTLPTITLPTVTMPTMPTVTMPSMPKCPNPTDCLPACPKVSCPSPTDCLPACPKLSCPSPTSCLPACPKLSCPSPTSCLPACPKPSCPSPTSCLPAFCVPSCMKAPTDEDPTGCWAWCESAKSRRERAARKIQKELQRLAEEQRIAEARKRAAAERDMHARMQMQHQQRQAEERRAEIEANRRAHEKKQADERDAHARATAEAAARAEAETKQKQKDIVARFLEENKLTGVDSVRKTLAGRKTPLRVAIKQNRVQVVRALLACGATPDISPKGVTALAYAQSKDNAGSHKAIIAVLKKA